MNIDDVLKDHSLGVSGGSNIKSIQRGYMKISKATTTITISKVISSNSIVKISYAPDIFSGGYSQTPKYVMFRAEMISDTTITITKNMDWHTFHVYWEVIEFEGIKSIQKGTSTTTTSRELIVTMSEVDLTKSTLIFSAISLEYYYSDTGEMLVSGAITSSNKLTFKGYTTDGMVVSWQVIEFK